MASVIYVLFFAVKTALLTIAFIGTGATVARQIQLLSDCGYVLERTEGSTKYLFPSALGIGAFPDAQEGKPVPEKDVRIRSV